MLDLCRRRQRDILAASTAHHPLMRPRIEAAMKVLRDQGAEPRRRHRQNSKDASGRCDHRSIVHPFETDVVMGDGRVTACTLPACNAGYPHLNVPAGFVYGLLVGLSFFGTAWSEPTLLKLGYGFEQATKARRKPQFFATLEFPN